ncbi:MULTISPECIES: alpha/beta hydrolase family protein [unclassified Paenibacillus]|uniref:dienelactone hydrolase family protein n=1 Tax=unclassified Paenibacillus TaxID=185978 RepID=UPI0010E4359A|nr:MULTISPECIES: alpha/beta hydrolase family protein [unclassified Paenibacillus]NIK69667.1 dienelactone hydrolase [Paenibacillus sp. BK720]TCM95843.1 alpha/beta hydrolase family protein [Paenibacillus sp. BK033]
MDWTVDAMLQQLYEQAERERRMKEIEAPLAERRHNLLSKLKQALGEFPDRNYPLNARLIDRTDYGDYFLERVAYSTMQSVQVPVWVLIPKDTAGPMPAVLACHGHGNGMRDAVGLDEQGRALDDPGIYNRFAVQLALRGMIVAIPEIMGFGARRLARDSQANPSGSSCVDLSSQLLMYGRTLAGMRVYEAIRALDYLQTREDVDNERLGVFGFSGGSLIGAYTSALDERVRATVLCGWVNTFQGSILSMHHCIDNYMPGLLLEAEQPELAGLLAPRALFVESGEHDPIFPVKYTRNAIEALREIYNEWEAAERLGWDIHPGKHEISGRISYSWLYETLMG